jgi:polyhydroxybutyrate depolymerase
MTRPVPRPGLNLTLLLIAVVCSGNSLAQNRQLEPTEHTFTTAAGDTRKYLLKLPAGYQRNRPAAVVFNFHGAGSTAEAQYRYADFDQLADRDHAILVMPDANKTYPDQDHTLASYWNSAWEANKRERDYDIDFILELVDQLQEQHRVSAFYATGMSAGGDITSALQCLKDSPFSAYAPVTYRYYSPPDCASAPPWPLLSFHGTQDQVVPISGLGDPWFDPSVPEIMGSWAMHNGCAEPVQESRISQEVLHYRWSGCAAPVEWYLVENGGHTWPGAADLPILGRTTRDFSASQLIWHLFFVLER